MVSRLPVSRGIRVWCCSARSVVSEGVGENQFSQPREAPMGDSAQRDKQVQMRRVRRLHSDTEREPTQEPLPEGGLCREGQWGEVILNAS